MERQEQLDNMLHIRFERRCYDIPLSELNIDHDSIDSHICGVVADWLDIPKEKVRVVFAVERNPDVNSITLRVKAGVAG